MIKGQKYGGHYRIFKRKHYKKKGTSPKLKHYYKSWQRRYQNA